MMNRTERRKSDRALKNAPQDASVMVPTRPVGEILADLDARLLDGDRQLRVLPSAVYDTIDHTDLRVWCNQRAIYGLPTVELVDWLKTLIDGRTAIEVGAGNGALGRALGIPRTDSWLQDQPDVQLMYRLQGQPTITYGPDVERLEAMEAVRKYRPQVVVGSWVTHWIDPNKPMPPGGGNMYGLHEDRILRFSSVESYVVVGHTTVHKHKPILQLPHRVIREPWVRSRAADPSGNAIFVWDPWGPQRSSNARG